MLIGPEQAEISAQALNLPVKFSKSFSSTDDRVSSSPSGRISFSEFWFPKAWLLMDCFPLARISSSAAEMRRKQSCPSAPRRALWQRGRELGKARWAIICTGSHPHWGKWLGWHAWSFWQTGFPKPSLNKHPNPIKSDPCTSNWTIYLLIVRAGGGSKAAHFWKFVNRKNQNLFLQIIPT